MGTIVAAGATGLQRVLPQPGGRPLAEPVHELERALCTREGNEVVGVGELHRHEPGLADVGAVAHEALPAAVLASHELDGHVLEEVGGLGADDLVCKAVALLVDADVPMATPSMW